MTFRERVFIAALQGSAARVAADMAATAAVIITKDAMVLYCAEFGHDVVPVPIERQQRCARCDVVLTPNLTR